MNTIFMEISLVDYKHAKKVMFSHDRMLGCRARVGDYYVLFLKSDMLQLIDVFFNFSLVSLITNRLDLLQKISLPNIRLDCILINNSKVLKRV